MRRDLLIVSLVLAGLLTSVIPVVAASEALPSELSEVGFDQRLGENVPLDLVFTDETGHQAELGALPVHVGPELLRFHDIAG